MAGPGGSMRAAWFGVVLALTGCEVFAPVDADFNADVDIGTDEREADAGADQEQPGKVDRPGQVAPERDAGAEPEPVADAGPAGLYDVACDAHRACEKLAPEGAEGTCWFSHTEDGRFAHDMFGHCTFDCGQVVTMVGSSGTVMEWRETKRAACEAIGGTCEQIGAAAVTHCVPGN